MPMRIAFCDSPEPSVGIRTCLNMEPSCAVAWSALLIANRRADIKSIAQGLSKRLIYHWIAPANATRDAGFRPLPPASILSAATPLTALHPLDTADCARDIPCPEISSTPPHRRRFQALWWSGV